MANHSDDDSDHASDENRGRGILSDVLAPDVITRLQYAGFLFLGLVVCLILKGSAGHALQSFTIFRRGCEFLQEVVRPDVELSKDMLHQEINLASPATHGSSSGLLSIACFENTLVYRISFSLALFFFMHLLSVSDMTCCVPAKARATMQERFFCFKALLLVLLTLLTFSVVPNHFFAGYAWLCMGVSALFLMIQVILLVDFSYQWSDEWSRKAENNPKWQWYLAAIAGGSYITGIIMCVLSFVYFVPHSDCNFNAFAITAVAVVPGVVCTLVGIWVPHGSIVPSGIVFAYCATMEFVTLRSAPDGYCNHFPGSNDATSIKSLLLSSCFSGFVLAYTVVSSSGNRAAMSLEAEEDVAQTDADEDGHLSGYMYFHSIMMMGAMYIAMLVSDWQISGADQGDGVGADAGSGALTQGTTAAFWVKHSSIWLTMAAYLWTLLAPYYCCKDRDYGIETEDW